MTAKEVVDEIYGIIQEASEIGATEVFLDLLQEDDPTFDTVNKLCRGADTTPNELKELRLFSTDGEFTLGTWDNEERIAHLEDGVRSDDLTALGKLQYLRYRYDRDMPVGQYVDRWISPDLRKLALQLSTATGDDTYETVLEMRATEDPTEQEGQTRVDDWNER